MLLFVFTYTKAQGQTVVYTYNAQGCCTSRVIRGTLPKAKKAPKASTDTKLAETGGNLGFVNLTSANGLGSDSIFQILVDENDYAWMVSNRGISSVDFKDMLKVVDGKIQHIDCKFYNQNDGLKSSGANSTALSMKDKYGRLWFTMADGFAVYDPVRKNASSILPIIQIVELSVDDKVYKAFENPIQIPAGTKHIGIKYTGLSFTASDRNRFSYMLEGYDSDFSDLTAFRTERRSLLLQ